MRIVVSPFLLAAGLIATLLTVNGCGGGGSSASNSSGERSLSAVTPTPSPTPTTSDTLPTIVNSGSTNTLGWTATVSPDGSVTYVNGVQSGSGTISTDLANQFYTDLNAAMPLSSLPYRACMKSASFGTTTVIKWQGQRSPDVSCPGNAAETALDKDANAIASALHLGGGRNPLQI